MEKRLTRKEKRIARQFNENIEKVTTPEPSLRVIKPLTINQTNVFNFYDENKNMVLMGSAGTGKTFLAIYLAMREILFTESSYKKLVIVRSCVPTRDIGFLPGDTKEKEAIYEIPYESIFNELFNKKSAYSYFKNQNKLEFISTSFIRGITLSDCIVIVDEIQNFSFQELDSITTRVGKNCKIVFAGDFKQSDLTKQKDGVFDFIDIIKEMKEFKFVEFDYKDIVRSGLVKSYIIMKEKMGK